MLSGSLRALSTALACGSLLWAASTFAQASQTWVDPPTDLGDAAEPEPAAASPSDLPVQGVQARDRTSVRAQAAQALAVDYLNLWSAPNQVTVASASAFYGPTVLFHGRERTIGSVLAEKRRFTERWPQRSYPYRPGTTMVACESDGALCTVWAIFDFSAANPDQGRRSLGIGEHELVVSLSDGRPVIVSETSRVLRRGPAASH